MNGHFRDTFIACRRGSIGLAFALIMIPVTAAVGVVLDYSAASNARTQFNAILDAAALAAVSPGSINSKLSPEEQQRERMFQAAAYFDAQLSVKPAIKSYIKHTAISSETIESSIHVKFCYYAEVNTNFMKLVKMKSIEFSNCISTVSPSPVYTDIYVLVDASGSMGIGASDADQTLMRNKLGCVFACHTVNWLQPTQDPKCTSKGDYAHTPNCAKMIGATLRFDVVKNALSSMIGTAAASSKVPDQYRFSIHKFSNHLTTVHSLSGSLTSVKNAVNLMTMDAVGAGTNFRSAMDQLNKIIPTGGDGKTPSTAKTVLVVMTDGVETNIYQPCTPNKTGGCDTYYPPITVPITFNFPAFYEVAYRMQVTDPSICNMLKARNIRIINLNMDYLVQAEEPHVPMQTIQKKLKPTIAANLAACASAPDLAFMASTPGQINLAMDKIFTAVSTNARINR